ncbi:MAG: hypothetical protein ACR2HY_03885 [Acidimicrobiales bacterium]
MTAGDFSNPPQPGDPGPGPNLSADKTRPKPKPTGFDPARSKTVDDQTTATKKQFVNPDGTKTVQVSPHPVRFRDPGSAGAWRDIDPTLSPAPDGTLRPKAAPSGARLAYNGEATVAAVDTSAGSIGLRHPGEQADLGAAAVMEGAKANYKGAVGGHDLTMAATSDGVEETVSLPDATASPTYTDELTLPAGVSARERKGGGVELADASGAVVATFTGGVARDAPSARGPGSFVPVSVRLMGTAPAAPVSPPAAAADVVGKGMAVTSVAPSRWASTPPGWATLPESSP